MKYSNQQYAEALYEALADASPKDHDLVMNNFVEMLKQNHDLYRFDQVVEAYEELDRNKRGVHQAEVTFAKAMEVNQDMMDQLNSIAHKQLETKTVVDDSIIGGVVVKIDDTLIDASIKGQLENLKKTLIN